jgi:hypothetical protein
MEVRPLLLGKRVGTDLSPSPHIHVPISHHAAAVLSTSLMEKSISALNASAALG